MNPAHQPTQLELVPTEILFAVIEHLHLRDMRQLSCVSKRLREICVPELFREVRFNFSESGLDGLRRLLISDVRQYIISLTYIIPEFLHTEMMDLEFFSCKVLRPGDYAEMLRTHDERDLIDMKVPHVLVYDTLKDICKEQCRITESNEDATALTDLFTQLPRLTHFVLCFCQTLAKERWVPFFMDQTVEQKTYGHHFPVISKALEARRASGAVLGTIHLSGLELPYYCSLRTPEARKLSNYLLELLKFVDNLRLSRSGSPLKSLSHNSPRLQQLDLCCLTVTDTTLYKFFRNADSIRSVGFHEKCALAPFGYTGPSEAGHLVPVLFVDDVAGGCRKRSENLTEQ